MKFIPSARLVAQIFAVTPFICRREYLSFSLSRARAFSLSHPLSLSCLFSLPLRLPPPPSPSLSLWLSLSLSLSLSLLRALSLALSLSDSACLYLHEFPCVSHYVYLVYGVAIIQRLDKSSDLLCEGFKFQLQTRQDHFWILPIIATPYRVAKRHRMPPVAYLFSQKSQ